MLCLHLTISQNPMLTLAALGSVVQWDANFEYRVWAFN